MPILNGPAVIHNLRCLDLNNVGNSVESKPQQLAAVWLSTYLFVYLDVLLRPQRKVSLPNVTMRLWTTETTDGWPQVSTWPQVRRPSLLP